MLHTSSPLDCERDMDWGSNEVLAGVGSGTLAERIMGSGSSAKIGGGAVYVFVGATGGAGEGGAGTGEEN